MASPRWAAQQERYRLTLEALGRTPATIESHLTGLRSWERFCASRHLSPFKPTESSARRWLALLYRDHSRNTVANYFKAVRVFFRWQGQANPFAAMPTPKNEEVPIRPYSPFELRCLVSAATTPRDRAIVLLLLGSGLRSAELINLRLSDIDWAEGIVSVVGKGNRPRRVCPGSQAMRALRSYLGLRQKGYVFPSRVGHLRRSGLYLLIRRLARRAGIDGGVHRFRHSFAHLFLSAGGDLGDLRVLLGHSTMQMAARYARYYESERALAAQRRYNPADALSQRVRSI